MTDPARQSESALQAAKRLLGWANGDHICKRCKGKGELYEYGAEDYYPCPDCNGEGEVALP